jgi:hypothetical protein
MSRKAALALVFVLLSVSTGRAEPVTLKFLFIIQQFDGLAPELAEGVFGAMPEIGSTMTAEVRVNSADTQPDPAYGTYYGTSFGSNNVGVPLALTLGSSRTEFRGPGTLTIGNNVDSPIVLPAPLLADAYEYFLIGFGDTLEWMQFVLANYTLPTSTFGSDAIPPTQVMRELRFNMAVFPDGWSCPEECPAFALSGTAHAIEDAAPVPEPASVLLLASGLGAIVARKLRRRAGTSGNTDEHNPRSQES